MDDTYTLVTTRDMDVPRDQVWRAWNDAERIARWWGPAGFTSTVEELEVSAGGKLQIVMHGPDGVDYPNTYVFDEVDQPRRLVYTNVGSEQFGLAPFQSVVHLEGLGETTRVTLEMRFASQEEKDKHVEQFHAEDGARELLERLEAQAR